MTRVRSTEEPCASKGARTVLETSGGSDPLTEFIRALRFGVQWRKRSLGTASDKGNRWVERILSLKETCRLQARSTYTVLVDAVTHFCTGQAPHLAWLQ
jgi:transposase